MNLFSCRRVREAVLSPSKEGGQGDNSLHSCLRAVGTGRGQVGQVISSPLMELSQRLGTGHRKQDLQKRQKKNELSPSLGTGQNGRNRGLRNLPRGLPRPPHDRKIDRLTRHQLARVHSLGENGRSYGALCHICASKTGAHQTPKSLNSLSINELSSVIFSAVSEGCAR